MPTQYLPATDKQTTKAQNKGWWEKILGRAKNPEDVTEFLFLILGSQITSNVMVVVTQPELDQLWPLLTPQEQNFFNTNKLQADDPKVVAFLAEEPPPIPV